MAVRKLIAALLPALCCGLALAQTVGVYHNGVPVVAGKTANVVVELDIDMPGGGGVLESAVFSVDGLAAEVMGPAQLRYCGNMPPVLSRGSSGPMWEQRGYLAGSMQLYADDAYSIKWAEAWLDEGLLTFSPGRSLPAGKSFLYLSISPDIEKIEDISRPFRVTVESVRISGKDFAPASTGEYRIGIPVRNSGDDGSFAYRIPGLVTTNDGTLIAVYDVRHNASIDLQSNIDIGMSRSTDGGRSWEPMRIIMDMGEWGGLPEAQNGIGDPSVLVDGTTGEIFVVAVWTHGIGTRIAWNNVGQGMSPEETGQLMIVSSKDDGLTWSSPRNITAQVKAPSWYLTLQGPGRGITMTDGTLVFPMQYIGPDRVPCATVMCSRDHGLSWTIGSPAKSNTTESQVVETAPGTLMLNMRDNRGTGRAVAVSSDLGLTWTEHPSSGALVEPVCMASIIRTGDILLFSNPESARSRTNLGIRASLDMGLSWSPGLVLDREQGWGYSCMSMTDPTTVGILYESSVGQILYQAVKLEDILKMTNTIETVPAGKMTYRGYEKGVSAPFFGRIGGTQLLAGGANFPEKSLLEGGPKKVYKEIFVRRKGGDWTLAGELPDSVAYGACFSVGRALVFAGGNVCGNTSDKVYKVSVRAGKAVVSELPSLPVPIEQAGWAQAGDKLYIVGGTNGSEASRAVYSCSTKDFAWAKIAELPGDALVQPIAFADPAGQGLYVWCGFSPKTLWAEDKGWFLGADGTWRPAPAVPDGGTFVGSTACPLGDGRLAVIGGVNRAIFERALRNTPEDRIPYLSQAPGAYRFRNTIYVFDPVTERWSDAGYSPLTALAGAGAFSDGNTVYVAGGEIKPGVRSPEIFSFTIK